MQQRVLALCLDDVPGADLRFPNLDARVRRFACLVGHEDELPAPAALLSEVPESPEEQEVADALADWLDLQEFVDLFSPTYAELDAEPEYEFMVVAQDLGEVADALRAAPHVRLLRDLALRDGLAFDPRVAPALQRLGAVPGEPAPGELPEPLRRILAIRWPEGRAFTWWDWAGGDLRFDLTFGPGAPLSGEYLLGRDGLWRVLALANGGDTFVVIRADDPDPANPMLYRLHQEELEWPHPARMATWKTLVCELLPDLPEDALPPR